MTLGRDLRRRAARPATLLLVASLVAVMATTDPASAALPGTTTKVSVDSAGNQGDSRSEEPSLSADGTVVAFASYAHNLVPGDSNSASDVFVRDLAAGTTTRVSVGSAGDQGDNTSYAPSISADGTVVAFESTATNLVPGDTNDVSDVFVHELAGPPAGGFSVSDASAKEGSRQSAMLRFTVTLAEARDSETAVRFRTVDGSAAEPGDYVARRRTLRFAPGQTSTTVEVTVNDDDLTEGDETLSLELFRAEGAPISEAVATGTILDDDD